MQLIFLGERKNSSFQLVRLKFSKNYAAFRDLLRQLHLVRKQLRG